MPGVSALQKFMKLLNGKKLADKIKLRLKKKIAKMKKKPSLAMVLVGSDQASKIYIRNKKKACKEVGIENKEITLPVNISQKKLIAEIKKLNRNKKITGIILQLPIPAYLDKYKVLEAIDPRKDADCLHHLNFGKFLQVGEKKSVVIPATAIGIIKLLEEYKIPVEGKSAVVMGYSDIVGKPTTELLIDRKATVTVCHSKTQNLKNITREADIIIVSTGVKNILTGDMVKGGVVVVDVGIHYVPNKKIYPHTRFGVGVHGDVDFASVSKKASFITPVPGGVGPMTVAMLMWNTVRLVKTK